jgi:hypothetical protein
MEATRGLREEWKYSPRNLPVSATSEESARYAFRRYAVAPFHEDATAEPVWDPYQGQLWPGFYQHVVGVMLASSFSARSALRQRRDLFSPLGRIGAGAHSPRASRTGPPVAPPSCPMVGDDGGERGQNGQAPSPGPERSEYD